MIQNVKEVKKSKMRRTNTRISAYVLSQPMLLTLCPRCLSGFFDMPDHLVRRANRSQRFKDECCMCGFRRGFDYLVYEKTLVA